MKGRRNETGLTPPDRLGGRPCQTGAKKSLGKCLRAMESQTGGAQLPKSMCLSVTGSSCLHLHAPSDGELTTYEARSFRPWLCWLETLFSPGAKTHLL